MKGNLQGIVRTRKLSGATVRNIKQNPIFSFVNHASELAISHEFVTKFPACCTRSDDHQRRDDFSAVPVIGNAPPLSNVIL